MANTKDGKIYCSICIQEIPYNRGLRSGDAPLCNKHLIQLKKHNKIFKRTVRDKNDIEIFSEHAEIILRNIEQEEICRALISIDQIEKVKDYKWCLGNHGYASSGAGKNQVLLHRLVMNAQKREIVDHKNRNKLDCRSNNLRVVTQSENTMNTKISKRNTSGIKGVWFNTLRKKWVAEIFVKGKKINLGSYIEKEDARIARVSAESIYFGEYAGESMRSE